MIWLQQIKNTWPWFKNPHQFLDICAQQEGRYTFTRQMPVMGHTLFTGDAKLIRAINNHPHLAAGKGIVALRTVLGDNSLIMLDDEAHAKRKKAIYPSFHGPQLKLLDQTYFNVAERTAKKLIRTGPFPIYDIVHQIALEAITRFMFGPQTPAGLNEAMEAINGFLFSFSSSALFFLRPLQIDLGPLSHWGRAVRKREHLRDLCRRHIQETRAGKRRDGVIAEMTQRGEDISDECLITEVLTLLMFGHDTAAQTMTWAMALLHQHPTLVEEVRAEINQVPIDDTLSPSSFPLLQACINESMRMRPVVVHLTRVVTKPVILGDFAMQEGDRVAPSPWLAHHNPTQWHEPSSFDATRFMGPPPAAFTWLPFGIGDRTCIGRALAIRQMPMILAGILRAKNLRLAPNYHPVAQRQLMLMVPKEGCPMQIVP